MVENFTLNEIFIIVYIPILLWMLGVIILFIKLAKKFTFGNWTKENPNPYALETFAMPRGAMRGILTMSLLFIVMLLETVNLVTKPGFEDAIEQLLTAFQMMLAFYFGSKVMHHVTKADERKTRAIVEEIEFEERLERDPEMHRLKTD
ncbi:MAG: hypothetical protein ACRBF0_17755 [Calditrichia bacterium]